MNQEEYQKEQKEVKEVKKEYQNFESFGFSSEIQKGVTDAGFKLPSPIQSVTIPKIFEGLDIVAQAHTGTGKTAAFGLPLMDMMALNEGVQGLVITPTRELANQVGDELYRLGSNKGIKTATVYGGQSYSRQLSRIENGANIIVATPGRLLDMLKSKKLRDLKPKFVVLDEADEMLDMGFLDDIKAIFKFIPSERQTLLFSATMPEPIKKLAKVILKSPHFISVTKNEITNSNIKQQYYIIEEYERDDAMTRLFDFFNPKKLIVFCRMKREVDRVATLLLSRGYSAKGLHGDMEQRQREEVIRSFKKGAVDILVATDVAARGLDISNVTHVFNYHIPFDPEGYVHRIGRTGRGDNSGLAITFATPLEFRELSRIQKKVGAKIEHCFIPTADEVKDIHLERFIDEIKHQKIDQNASKIMESLEQDMDISQICYKLLSMLGSKIEISGSNKIGIDKDRIKRILEQKKRDSGNRSRGGGGGNRRFRGRSGGGSRDGGGGSRDRNGGGGNRDRRGGSGSGSGSGNSGNRRRTQNR